MQDKTLLVCTAGGANGADGRVVLSMQVSTGLQHPQGTRHLIRAMPASKHKRRCFDNSSSSGAWVLAAKPGWSQSVCCWLQGTSTPLPELHVSEHGEKRLGARKKPLFRLAVRALAPHDVSGACGVIGAKGDTHGPSGAGAGAGAGGRVCTRTRRNVLA